MDFAYVREILGSAENFMPSFLGLHLFHVKEMHASKGRVDPAGFGYEEGGLGSYVEKETRLGKTSLFF